MAEQTILSARNLQFSYSLDGRRVPALQGVNLEVRCGEMIAIQGSSGSGKSTLLYVLGCMLQADSGQLVVEGRDVTALSADELAWVRNRSLGFVFQQFHLLPRASVLENILLPSRYPCETAPSLSPTLRERAEGIARELGLGEHLRHLPNQLSGGQQQRVAIARALLNDASLILADEPTGNLDSRNATQIIELLKELNRKGKTIVIITHDPEIARHCQKIYFMRDGVLGDGETNGAVGSVTVTESESGSVRFSVLAPTTSSAVNRTEPASATDTVTDNRPIIILRNPTRVVRKMVPLVWENLRRNRGRSLLTMSGVTLGIASVLAMVTLGNFSKAKILGTYEALGVNKVRIRGWPNWQLKATDKVGVSFRSFSMEKDLEPLRGIFPEVRFLSPVMNSWNSTVNFNGLSVSDNVRVFGVNAEYQAINNRQLLVGRGINPFHVENRDSVCVVGHEIARRLFMNVEPVGQIVYLTTGNPQPFACQVIGVFKPQKSNEEWFQPNLQVLVPYTVFPALAEGWWNSQITTVMLQVNPGSDIESVGKSIKGYFKQKYGKSGRFDVDSDDVLVGQMKRFLNIFAVLLAAIASVSLLVGGMGITNMMLVSVSERLKEIGLRKALGATDYSIRIQFLLESVALCAAAGILGIVLGFGAYETMIYAASKLTSKLEFEWVFEPGALLLSVVSILAVGIASGFIPALKAERLQVIEALRNE